MHHLARLVTMLAAVAPEVQQRFVADQFRQASGLFGPVWGWLMNRGNRRMISAAVGLLEHGPGAHLLEVGIGGAVGVAELLRRIPEGRLTGTELSEVLLEGARRKFAADVASGRLNLVRATIEQLPCETGSIDAAVTVNTIYFWTSPEQAMAELRRVLRPEGQLVIAFRVAQALRRFRYTQHGLTLYEPELVEALLASNGFTRVRLVERGDDRLGYCCAIGYRPRS